jgi:hypothetical protein
MNRYRWTLAGAALLTLSLGGCSSPGEHIVKSEALRTDLIEQLNANPEVAGDLVRRLLESDEGRGAVLGQVMQNAEAAQGLMLEIAKSQTMVDGIVNLAVQDPAMRTHLESLFQGMAMGKGQ